MNLRSAVFFFLGTSFLYFKHINTIVDVHQETLVHSSNHLATKALKDGRKHLSFVKSCIAFSEVTIPSISDHIRHLNLYIETSEVMLSSFDVFLLMSAAPCY